MCCAMCWHHSLVVSIAVKSPLCPSDSVAGYCLSMNCTWLDKDQNVKYVPIDVYALCIHKEIEEAHKPAQHKPGASVLETSFTVQQ